MQKSAQRQPRRGKYNARKTEIDGITFDSAKEAARYSELRLLEKAGEITGLEWDKRKLIYALYVNRELICSYEADFCYYRNGIRVIEDVKSPVTRTPVYLLKKKLMFACYGIKIQEV